MTLDEKQELLKFSKRIQMETMKTIAGIGVGHVGGSLSIADLLAVLYGRQMRYRVEEPEWADRDWLVVSKGHAGPAVYSALALKGFFPMEQLQTLNQPGTMLPSHCDHNRTPGIDVTTGSLGQGASAAAGVAAGLKLDRRDSYVYLILGDGELEEGQVWEMAIFARHRKLDHLIAFVDNNHLQIDGLTEDVSSMGDIGKKFEGFGWYVQNANGHDPEEIDEAINRAKLQKGSPSVIVLDTVKGHGWKRIEGLASCHSMSVTPQDLKSVLEEMQEEFDKIVGG